jgi:hypothetical protein
VGHRPVLPALKRLVQGQLELHSETLSQKRKKIKSILKKVYTGKTWIT